MNDLDRLDAYLSSELSPETSMGLSDLDGYLTGAICMSGMPSLQACLAATLGDPARVPEDILNIVIKRYEAILERLCSGRILEPVFWQAPEGHVIAMDWCEGFMGAVKAHLEPWQAFMQTDIGAQLMTPILVHLIDDEGNSRFGIHQEDLDAVLDMAAAKIPESVTEIFAALRSARI
ncbi:YecA family protein [Shimia aestuarii]|uniref:YecA family protein n=1 Tax=Shimia aestuarii TaxID=254406 RepID=A0A1I4T7J8_9RHOB|nr:YecA family protein [Shimia aestuarii]SFM72714.1 uncharacterized protein SAMN04488042_11430 [Shimia aestuarii]